ncbi:sigma-70 family RNA polymerase sigma factor, partial [Clostridium perfringens]|nr:sigma-70 family RNA polymerase sigma factor [Clostridium perfringens]MBO3357155.1 sigma-70 family RNA polymerase sigma factor [Clostridium perfringens]MBO3360409.1 sigma-70 family RNA polymerase sigma factor [Clostridium perfringens]MBO3360426.1 sigma-70 family RNA polymerase sigma factor [Clostridium perfringens]
MNKIKELEKFLSSYRIIKADIEDLKLREKEENINLSCEIERLQSKVNRIDNAMNILDMKERDIIKE